MRKLKVMVAIGCRSDEGLSKPVIDRLKKNKAIECIKLFLTPSNFNHSYVATEYMILVNKPDIILITGDRVEMTAAACAAFHTNIPIAHFYAGIINYVQASKDDRNRHCITMWADMAFCEDENSCEVAIKLWQRIGRYESYNVHNVGISHLDDIIRPDGIQLGLDMSMVPDEPYNLILINPATLNEKEDPGDLLEPENDFLNIRIQSNPDVGSVDIEVGRINAEVVLENLPRRQFLGLISMCSLFITNSSSGYYEAPFLMNPKNIRMVGDRNKDRSTPKILKMGASDKVVKILEEWWETYEK